MRCIPVLLGVLAFAGVASANPVNGTETPWATGGELPIIGGTQATVGEFPTVVAITAGSGAMTGICTGTLVDREWVLTAAHCLDKGLLGFSTQDQVTASVRVYYHTVSITTSAGRANVRRATLTIPKPTFNIDALGSNDIGLIKLAQPIDNDPTGKPIVPSPVNLEAGLAPVGVTVTQVGFGATAQSGGGSVGVMYKLPGRISTMCEDFGAGSSTNLLCFNQQDNKGKCQGDSGGPSFAMIGGKPTVVGVTSFGDQNCQFFGADTRTNIEKDFLLMYAPLGPKCGSDDECPNGICFQGQCMAEPFEGTGLGAECADAANCESMLCADGPGGTKCTMTCTKGDNSSCPSGFECIDAGTTGVCWPGGDGGGCCDASGTGAPTALLGFGLLALVWRRKRH
jgi:hypothetical protein